METLTDPQHDVAAAQTPSMSPTPTKKNTGRFNILKQLWYFLRIRKKWWLAPLLIILILFALLLVFAQTSPLAPFIYTIF
jgi:hypothetical protein